MKTRPAARVLILNSENNVLLFQFGFEDGPLEGEKYWATPGGGVEKGESFKEAAQRELLEETGIDTNVGEEIGQRDAIFRVPSGEFVKADERYFSVRVNVTSINEDGQSLSEKKYMKQYHWWSLTELQNTSETVFPEQLIELIKTI